MVNRWEQIIHPNTNNEKEKEAVDAKKEAEDADALKKIKEEEEEKKQAEKEQKTADELKKKEKKNREKKQVETNEQKKTAYELKETKELAAEEAKRKRRIAEEREIARRKQAKDTIHREKIHKSYTKHVARCQQWILACIKQINTAYSAVELLQEMYQDRQIFLIQLKKLASTCEISEESTTCVSVISSIPSPLGQRADNWKSIILCQTRENIAMVDEVFWDTFKHDFEMIQSKLLEAMQTGVQQIQNNRRSCDRRDDPPFLRLLDAMAKNLTFADAIIFRSETEHMTASSINTRAFSRPTTYYSVVEPTAKGPTKSVTDENILDNILDWSGLQGKYVDCIYQSRPKLQRCVDAMRTGCDYYTSVSQHYTATYTYKKLPLQSDCVARCYASCEDNHADQSNISSCKTELQKVIHGLKSVTIGSIHDQSALFLELEFLHLGAPSNLFTYLLFHGLGGGGVVLLVIDILKSSTQKSLYSKVLIHDAEERREMGQGNRWGGIGMM